MKKISFKNYISSGYVITPNHDVELVKMRLVQLGYFDIKIGE